MAKLENYAFLIKHKSFDSSDYSTALKSNDFSTTIVGVHDVERAVEVARNLIENGIQLVELCGGFTLEEKEYIANSIDRIIPIGLAVMDEADEEKLKLL